jgi:hypothetical protein
MPPSTEAALDTEDESEGANDFDDEEADEFEELCEDEDLDEESCGECPGCDCEEE